MTTSIIGGTKDRWGFDPRAIPGIYAWFDATDSNSVILDGSSNVSAWLDKTGNNRHLFQNNSNFRPGYASNYVRCVSGNQQLDTSGFPATNTAYTILCLSKPLTKADASDGAFTTFRSLYSPAVTNQNILALSNLDSNIVVNRAGGGNNVASFVELTSCSGGNTILTYNMFASRSGTISYNGSGLVLPAGTHTTSLISKVGNDPSANNAWGEIQEILVYSPNIEIHQQRQVEAYLAWKGGLGYEAVSTPATNPLSVTSATCFQWFDASDTTNIDLSGSTRWARIWRDKSGLGLDASAAPANTVWYNPNGYMDVSGTAFFTQRRDISGYLINKSYSFFVVESRRYTGTGYMIGAQGGGVGSNLFFGYSNVNNLLITHFGDNQILPIPYSYATVSYNYNPEDTTIWYCSFDASTSYRAIASNGFVRINHKASTPLLNTVNMFIGKAGSTGSNYNGYLYEVIMYDNVLSPTDESNVGSYLSRKWNINTNLLTFTSPYRDRSPFNRMFSPCDISSLAIWYDAADPATVTVSGDLVTNWADKSGSLRDASTTSNWPTYTPGSNYVQFSGSNWIRYPGTALVNTQYTLFYTANRDVSKASHFFMSSGTNTTTNTNLHIGYEQNTVMKYAQWANDFTFTVPGFDSNAEPINIWCFQQNPTQRLAFLNSSQVGSNNNSTLVGGNTDGLLGVYFRSSNTAWNGKWYEVNMFRGALNTAQRQQMEGYLAWKWGLINNLSANHPYYAYPPPNPTFHPLAPTNPILWLDAMDQTTYEVSGNIVTDLWEKSGYKGNLTKTLGFAFRPGWNSNGLNGYPCFLTDTSATGRRLYGTYGNAARVSAQRYTVVLVAEPTPRVQNSSRIFSTQATTGDDVGSGGGFNINSPTTPSSVAPYPIASQRVATIERRRPNTFSNVPTIFTITGVTSAAGILSNWGFGLAVMFPNNGGGALWELKVGEALVYRNILDSNSLNMVEGYLAWKWGIPTSLSNTISNHPYIKIRP